VFLGPYFKNESAACKFTRYHKVRLIGFGWSRGASMSVGVSAFQSRGIYPFNCNKVPEYLFSISDTSENITYMETTPANMAVLRVPSTTVTNSQNMLTIPAKTSLCILSTIRASDTSPGEITSTGRLMKINPITKAPRIYLIERIAIPFFVAEEANNIKEKPKKQRGNEIKEQKKGKCKQPQYYRSTRSENAVKKSINQIS
jgi:hypothetical protein